MPKQLPQSRNLPTHLRTGQLAEDFACRYLIAKGLELRTRNYRCPCGELDLVMKDQDTIVIIEVRYRCTASFGDGLDSVDWRKQQKLRHAAKHYLQHYGLINRYPVRFDVIALSQPMHADTVRWISDAFGI